MSHQFLYAVGVSKGAHPEQALQNALNELHRHVSELKEQYSYVTVTSHSHTLTPGTVAPTTMWGSEKQGWIASVTAAVEYASVPDHRPQPDQTL